MKRVGASTEPDASSRAVLYFGESSVDLLGCAMSGVLKNTWRYCSQENCLSDLILERIDNVCTNNNNNVSGYEIRVDRRFCCCSRFSGAAPSFCNRLDVFGRISSSLVIEIEDRHDGHPFLFQASSRLLSSFQDVYCLQNPLGMADLVDAISKLKNRSLMGLVG